MVRNNSNLPPGFRFHPTDEELIMYYLRNQASSKPCPVSIIPEVDIYKSDPWDLPAKTNFGEKEWYFFSPRDRKYPNGVRPNRAAVSGYWKATGTDKAIYSGSKYVGVKKALVFYQGKPPKGTKTNWIMHEYRLSESRSHPKKQLGSMRLDDWVLCRIYEKKSAVKSFEQREDTSVQTTPIDDNNELDVQSMKFPRTFSLSHLWEFESFGSISHLLGDQSFNNTSYDNQSIMSNGETEVGVTSTPQSNVLGEMANRNLNSIKFEVNHNGNNLNQSIFYSPMYEF